MKKTNIIVTIIVSIVVVIVGVFIFMPNNNTAFESYYNEIKRIDEYQDQSNYLDINVSRDGEYVDFIFTDAKEDLMNVKVLIIPENASLRFSKTFLSVGFLEAYKVNVYPKDSAKTNTEGNVWTDGLAASMKNNENDYLIYLEFDLTNGSKVKEYLEIEVED